MAIEPLSAVHSAGITCGSALFASAEIVRESLRCVTRDAREVVDAETIRETEVTGCAAAGDAGLEAGEVREGRRVRDRGQRQRPRRIGSAGAMQAGEAWLMAVRSGG